MGGAVSTNRNQIEANMLMEIENKCPSVSSTNVSNIKNLNFQPPAAGVCTTEPTFGVSQRATVESNCQINSMIDVTAVQLSKLNAAAQTDLGYAESNNIQDLKNQITAKINNNCGDLNASNVATFDNVNITACQFRLPQDASVQALCKIENMQRAISNIATESATTATGGSILGAIFGSGNTRIITIIIIIVGIVALIIGFKYFKSSPQGMAVTQGSQMLGGGIFEDNTWLTVLAIIGIVLVAYFLYRYFDRRSQTQVTVTTGTPAQVARRVPGNYNPSYGAGSTNNIYEKFESMDESGQYAAYDNDAGDEMGEIREEIDFKEVDDYDNYDEGVDAYCESLDAYYRPYLSQ